MSTRHMILPIPDGYDCTELRFTLKRSKTALESVMEPASGKIPVKCTRKKQKPKPKPEPCECECDSEDE